MFHSTKFVELFTDKMNTITTITFGSFLKILDGATIESTLNKGLRRKLTRANSRNNVEGICKTRLHELYKAAKSNLESLILNAKTSLLTQNYAVILTIISRVPDTK